MIPQNPATTPLTIPTTAPDESPKSQVMLALHALSDALAGPQYCSRSPASTAGASSLEQDDGKHIADLSTNDGGPAFGGPLKKTCSLQNAP